MKLRDCHQVQYSTILKKNSWTNFVDAIYLCTVARVSSWDLSYHTLASPSTTMKKHEILQVQYFGNINFRRLRTFSSSFLPFNAPLGVFDRDSPHLSYPSRYSITRGRFNRQFGSFNLSINTHTANSTARQSKKVLEVKAPFLVFQVGAKFGLLEYITP